MDVGVKSLPYNGNTNVCTYLIAQEEVCQRYINASLPSL